MNVKIIELAKKESPNDIAAYFEFKFGYPKIHVDFLLKKRE